MHGINGISHHLNANNGSPAEFLPPEVIFSILGEQFPNGDLQLILSASSGVMSELVSGKRELTKEHS